MPSIRPARPDDIDAVAAVQRASILSLAVGAYGPEGATAWAEASAAHAPTLLGSGTFFVAEEEEAGRVVAVGGWSPHDPLHDRKPDAAWIRSLFVYPEHAGRGLGRRVMAAVEGSACAAGRTTFLVRASLNAVGFYAKIGYTEVERSRWPLPSGPELEHVLMVKGGGDRALDPTWWRLPPS